MKTLLILLFIFIGDWGLGIGDWPNPQSPIPNPQMREYLKQINNNYNYLFN